MAAPPFPVHRALFRAIVGAAVAAAGSVPVTVKLRIGIDDAHVTFIEAGRIAEDEGAAAVTLHARTAEQLYSGRADWEAIAELKARITSIPVLGNGDLWEASDALAMVAATGCDGVVVGRGCLGRPWLFRDLADAFAGRPLQTPPDLGEIVDDDADPRRPPVPLLRRGPGRPPVPQARRLVPDRIRGRVRRSAGRWPRPAPWPRWTSLLGGLDPTTALPARGEAHGPRPHQRTEAGPPSGRMAGRRRPTPPPAATSWLGGDRPSHRRCGRLSGDRIRSPASSGDARRRDRLL